MGGGEGAERTRVGRSGDVQACPEWGWEWGWGWGGGGGGGCHRLLAGELRPASGHPPPPVSPNVSNPFPWLARALSAPHCSHSKHGTWEEKIPREFPHCLSAPISVSPLLSQHFCFSVSHSLFVLASPPLPSAPHSVCVCGGRSAT